MEEEIKILCIDDEANVLKSLERLFIDEEYEIITATSGEEGLNILKNTEIQIVVSDYRMPGMNGVDFLKEVYKGWPDTVRIVLSGFADTAAVVDAINEGHIYKFIPKPWNDDELKITITNAIELYDLKRQNDQLTLDLQATNEELELINNNLEKLVEERTSEIIFQNKVLERSQNILEVMPVAVIGIDLDGLIVQCNQKLGELFQKKAGDVLGKFRQEVFSEETNTIITDIINKGLISGKVTVNGKALKVKGSSILDHSEQVGVILVFDDEG